MPRTMTVLTIDLPIELGDRLQRCLRRRPGQSIRDVAIEALEEWLDRHGREPDDGHPPSPG